MITARPRLYYNTGLRVGHIPERASCLDSWSITYRDFDDHVGLQDLFLSTFKLKATWNDVKNADYMKYGDAYYWIKPRMINENCAEITCMLDAITSMGGPLALSYTPAGTITRAHPLNRSDMTNIVEEDIKPSNILRAIVHPISFSGGANQLRVVASTVKLDDPSVSLSPNITRDALVFSGQVGLTADDKYTVCIPKGPAASASTILQAFGQSYNSVGYGLYDADNATVKTNLEYLRSLGLSDAVLFSYTIPKDAISFSESADGFIISLYGTSSPWASGTSITVGSIASGIHFNKCYMMDRSFTIRGRLSGDCKTFKAHELAGLSPSTSSSINFYYATDPGYQGTKYCAPGSYYGNSDTYTRISNSAKGLPWAECPISIGGATCSQWSWNKRALDLSENGVLGINNLGGLAQFGGRGLATNLAGIAATLGQAVVGKDFKPAANMDPRDYENAKASMGYAQALVQAPELTSSPAYGLQNYVDNTFDIIELAPSANDLQNMDRVFELYGYRQPNIAFDKSYMSSMPSWNYIEGFGITIAPNSASDYGISIKEAAEAQLNGGCTIWHVKPSTSAHNY